MKKLWIIHLLFNCLQIEGNIDPAQVFLWLQEKSFFNGYQLQNLRPGEFLSTLDMARNLVLAPLLKISPQLQEINHFLVTAR